MTVFVRLLWTSVALGLTLGSQGCADALSTPNPRNCVISGAPCDAGSVCNTATQVCEPATPDADCVAQPSACTAAELCDPEDKRCVPRRFVLGQPDDSSNLNVSYGLYQPQAAKLLRDEGDGGKTKLAVAEWGSNRALIWNDIPTMNRPADVVLGQQDVQTTTLDIGAPPGQVGFFKTPWSIASDGFSLVLAEKNWNRISMWSPIPTMSGMDRPLAPSGFWGQSSYVNNLANAGAGMVSALGDNFPLVFAEQGRGNGFYVADRGNRRVLVFAGIPQDYTTSPKWVIGQPDFSSSAQRPPQSGIGSPYGIFSDGTQLFVADDTWNRVLGYNLPITRNDPTPDLVIGQPDLTSTAKNRGGAPAANSLNTPSDVEVTSQGGVRRLWVADSGNHRVLRYDLPSMSANLVLGQQNFLSGTQDAGGQVGRIGFGVPTTVSSDGVHLVVAESQNHRVQIWNSLPERNAQPSDVILGQPNDKSSATYMPPAIHSLQFREPNSVSSDGTRLFVADTGHNRVLIWNRIPKDGKTPPDVVLGQLEFTGTLANQGGVSASSLSSPSDIRSDGTRLYVADTENNRVLIWNQIPTQSFAPADVVIGQPSMSSNTFGASAQLLREPQGIALQNGWLWISDTKNNRVLRFEPPFVTSAAATLVLGQPDMTSRTPNAGGGPTELSIWEPGYMDSDGQRLVLADTKNFRVLIWNQPPTANFQPASVAVGEVSWNTVLPSANKYLRLYNPYGVRLDAGRLFVSSSFENRIMVWNQVPTSLGAPASSVLGQADFDGHLPNDARLAPVDRLTYPMGMTSVSGRLFIADRHNNRVVSTELPQ